MSEDDTKRRLAEIEAGIVWRFMERGRNCHNCNKIRAEAHALRQAMREEKP